MILGVKILNCNDLRGASQSTQRLLPGISDFRVLMACKSMIEVRCPFPALLDSLLYKNKTEIKRKSKNHEKLEFQNMKMMNLLKLPVKN